MDIVITEEDLVTSVADALQYSSYHQPADYISHLERAYERERSALARDAIAQILTNSRMAVFGRRPICQDTGIVEAFVRIGTQIRWATSKSLNELINEGVRRAYLNPDNKLRASIVSDPLFSRRNTGDNTPAVVHAELVSGATLEITLAAKGAGSENKARLAMLNPSDSVVDWILETVPKLGAGWCPPGLLGIGIGGTADKAMLLAKEALLEPLDMHELIGRQPTNEIEALRLELYEKINALGIGAQGLGGVTTVLDVKVRDFPTHAASKPVALVPNCAATRVVRFVLDGSGPATFLPPSPEDWPNVAWIPSTAARRVNLDSLTKSEVQTWRSGENLLLTGKLLTGRDAAHKRIADLLARGEPLPPTVDFRDRVIYYVGPVDPVRTEAVGPAGPTTAARMDEFTDVLLERTGLLAMIGKAERGPAAIVAIRKHRAAYLIAVGGAAYLISKAIRRARVVAFADLGMEAIYEFEVAHMPVTVAVDCNGDSLHQTGPAEWRMNIETLGIPMRRA